MLPRWFLSFCALAAIAPALAQDAVLDRYDRVEVAPAKTSIYIGTVSLNLTPALRKSGIYVAGYEARVSPFFFYSESGRMFINVSDDALRRLASGEVIDFTGRGVNTDGSERRVEGRVTPADAVSGRIKVRIFVTKRIQLIFNTTYRLAG